jgi:hypothetical protein
MMSAAAMHGVAPFAARAAAPGAGASVGGSKLKDVRASTLGGRVSSALADASGGGMGASATRLGRAAASTAAAAAALADAVAAAVVPCGGGASGGASIGAAAGAAVGTAGIPFVKDARMVTFDASVPVAGAAAAVAVAAAAACRLGASRGASIGGAAGAAVGAAAGAAGVPFVKDARMVTFDASVPGAGAAAAAAVAAAAVAAAATAVAVATSSPTQGRRTPRVMQYKVSACELVGTERIDVEGEPEEKAVLPSDHFGVLARLKLCPVVATALVEQLSNHMSQQSLGMPAVCRTPNRSPQSLG